MNVILVSSNYRHVLVTHVAIFKGGKNKNTIIIILYSRSYHPAVVMRELYTSDKFTEHGLYKSG